MPKIKDQEYIIAIGASAGGLEAISAFFDHTPLDAVSYILIQHLSSHFKSQMANILAPHSKLDIIEVINHIKIEPNKVYLIPNTKFMVIKDGMLVLSDKADRKPPHMTINYFFQSLAKECGNKAIGIILSGTGTDGSKGIEAIKAAGGMVLVQEPETAAYSGMPSAAIDTDCADMIISPKEMPKVIEDYVKNGVLMSSSNQENTPISETDLLEIFNLIKGNLPLDFSDYKRPTILRRIKRRMAHHNLSQVDKYYQLLENQPEEIRLLANDFLISVTSFFRDPEAFKIIETIVIPDIINNKKQGDILKIWVAGCATGEEAYSLAILIQEHLNKVKKDLEVKIFATDINKTALDVASKGIYTHDIEKAVSKARLDVFFTEEGDNWKVTHAIRKMLIFAQHDLVKNPPYCDIELISCRNLLIYMNPTLQKKVFSMMHFGLKKDGYLFLGPSENASVLKADFDEISNKWNLLKSNKKSQSVRFDAFSSPVIEQRKTKALVGNQNTELPANKWKGMDEFNLAILKESGLNGVCTDSKLQVIHSFGDTRPFLKDQNFNFDLIDLLPDAIAITLKAAAYKALKVNQKVVLNGLVFTDAAKLVDIIIRPVDLAKSEDKLVLILFTENDNSGAVEKSKGISLEELSQLTMDHVINIEKELAEAKSNLLIAHDRVESSNENMQSFNEELQSANEEMQSANEELQSTNEELQSVNEELQTINKEHQITNAELTESNDDLNNYFRSNVNGQLFVDKDLLLKKFSPGAMQHINIRESDIGRPLSNITTNIKLDSLVPDINKVIATGETIIKEAESKEGKFYQIMTMPYIRKHSKTADGAIISFYDITELKKISEELDASNKSLLRINDNLNNFVYGASHDLNAPINNIEMVLAMLNKKLDLADPKVSKLSGMMDNAIRNFKEMIHDLSKVGHIEAEMNEGSQIESFEDIFNEIKEIISERIKHLNVHFQIDFKEKEIQFPKTNLRSILLNLITNAIKFSSSGRYPEIIIHTQRVDQFIMLTVKDNGIGINPDRLNFIFKMYQRINGDVEGQGIGLYLIKKIIDASGGKIEVESEAGKGSTFKIYFKVNINGKKAIISPLIVENS
ncbi:MAG: chemotaxis protein CheR [Sphingobacteriales bacterium]|nr:chemotaxis protein CheR [Sphingobacteriales bacterium]